MLTWTTPGSGSPGCCTHIPRACIRRRSVGRCSPRPGPTDPARRRPRRTIGISTGGTTPGFRCCYLVDLAEATSRFEKCAVDSVGFVNGSSVELRDDQIEPVNGDEAGHREAGITGDGGQHGGGSAAAALPGGQGRHAAGEESDDRDGG